MGRPNLRLSHSSGNSITGAGCCAARVSAKPPISRIPGETDAISSTARYQPPHRILRVLRFFEAHGRVRPQLQCRRCFADACSLEAGAFQDNASGSVINRAVEPADHACNRDWLLRIGDYQVRSCEVVRFAVQRLDLLALPCAANENRVPMQLARIEGVHRLRKLRHDVVRHVDNIVYGIEPDRPPAGIAATAATAPP